MQLTDKFDRPATYLRLAVTDRCNLRCAYCMPQHQVFGPKNQLLTFEEMLRLCSLLTENGVRKIRLTGGEPLIRKGIMSFISALAQLPNAPHICLTTNGVATLPYLPALWDANVRSLNLSLDSLQPERFAAITFRNQFAEVWRTFEEAHQMGFQLKLNMVVMKETNHHEIAEFAQLAYRYKVGVRFIEEMPFSGGSREVKDGKPWMNYREIIGQFLEAVPELQPLLPEENTTATVYGASSLKGTVGVIPAHSRTFCGTCNRIRVTSTGNLRTCLYGKSALNLRDLMRQGITDAELLAHIRAAISQKAINGMEAEKQAGTSLVSRESMSEVGG